MDRAAVHVLVELERAAHERAHGVDVGNQIGLPAPERDRRAPTRRRPEQALRVRGVFELRRRAVGLALQPLENPRTVELERPQAVVAATQVQLQCAGFELRRAIGVFRSYTTTVSPPLTSAR